jgi:hypothetical protein
MPRCFSLAVVGADYPNRRGPGRRFEIQICAPGEPVALVPEPRNVADPNAIAVYSCREIQIGYLTAERAPWVGALMRRSLDVQAVFQCATQSGALIRASFDGSTPTLPPAPTESAAVEEDFWPDYIPPDD